MNYDAAAVMADPRGYLTEKQIAALLSACRNKRDRALFQVMYRCGRRVSEVLALKREDIDWKSNRVIFRILKKRHFHEEVKPVDRDTMRTLKEYLEDIPACLKKRDDVLIFPVSRQYVFKLMRQIGEDAGITHVGRKGLHPHHLRHSFAVHQVRNNVKTVEQLRMLQRYMGHTNIAMTAHYLQFSTDDMKEITNLWDNPVDKRDKKSTKTGTKP